MWEVSQTGDDLKFASLGAWKEAVQSITIKNKRFVILSREVVAYANS